MVDARSVRARVGGCLELEIGEFWVLSRPWPEAGGNIQCAARAKPPPCRASGWSLRLRHEIEQEHTNMEGKIDVEMRLRWTWKVSENASKIVSKSVENSIKSSFGAVLEHFGDPLGAKMVQKLRQDLENMKNIRF